MARMIVDYIIALLVESAFARLPTSTLTEFPRRNSEEDHTGHLRTYSGHSPTGTPTPRSRVPSLQMSSLSPAVVAELQSAMPYRRGSLQRSDSATSSTTMTSLAQQAQTLSGLKRTSSLAASLKTLALTGSSEPSSPHTTGSFSHILDHLPSSPIVPEPHVVVIDYIPPWNPNAASIPLPSPSRHSHHSSSSSAHSTSPNGGSSGIKLSPSWTSLSSRPSFTPSTLVFPKKSVTSNVTNGNGHHNHLHAPDHRDRERESFTAFDVICALVDEDLTRQRNRYAQYHDRAFLYQNPGASTSGTSGTSPLALGSVDTIADLLPFRSTLFDSCAEYYSEAQMKVGSQPYCFQKEWNGRKDDESDILRLTY